MTKLREAVAAFRNSIGAILRIHPARKEPRELGLTIGGSAWCIAENRYFVTAHHVLNDGAERDPNDKFAVFVTPDNGVFAHHFPVIDVPFADPALDLAIVEVGAPSTPGIVVSPIPVTVVPVPDGSQVLTLGFPAPEISAANVDQDGNWLGGNVFLKSHANEGIVSAQYEIENVLHYELNVGWHHGESGGPVIRLDEPAAAFSVMQFYRNINTPHGVVAGPHMGRALVRIETVLRELGARLI